jgi:ubiquinone/menaquinone biosynthesis C-methylase UbiE
MLVSAIEGHRLWADSYDASPNPLLALETRLLREMFGFAPSMRVVDVACGTGRWAAYFAARGADVLGIDFCREMLQYAPINLRGRLVLGRAEALPAASRIADLAICCFAAGYLSNLEQAIAEMARITRSGGRVVITDLHPAAVAAGWTRSFRANGGLYEIEHFGHSLERIGAATLQAGLKFAFQAHGRFGEPERPIFEAAGKRERFAEVSATPAVWIGGWRKP